MKATLLLRKQHRKVEAIFEKLENSNGDASALLTELANDLVAHMAIEQTIFYPAVREIDPDTIGKSYQEHAIAELALKRLLATATDDPTFAPKVTALRELIELHVDEEEEDLFPEVEKRMEPEQLDELGSEMLAAFEDATDRGYEALLPEGLVASADVVNASPSGARARRVTKVTSGRSRRTVE